MDTVWSSIRQPRSSRATALYALDVPLLQQALLRLCRPGDDSFEYVVLEQRTWIREHWEQYLCLNMFEKKKNIYLLCCSDHKINVSWQSVLKLFVILKQINSTLLLNYKYSLKMHHTLHSVSGLCWSSHCQEFRSTWCLDKEANFLECGRTAEQLYHTEAGTTTATCLPQLCTCSPWENLAVYCRRDFLKAVLI